MELVKVIAILALLVFLIRKNVQIGHSLSLTAVLFGLLHGMPVLDLGRLVLTTLLSSSTLIVFAALVLISLLENVMRYTGGQQLLVNGMKHVSGDPRFAMAALPAIIGLLPSPGGARFSAPLVEEAGKGLDINVEQNATINFWYRHVWEYFLPLYSTSLLSIEILKVPYNTYMLTMLPLTIIAIFVGFLLLRELNIPAKNGSRKSSEAWKEVAEGLAPIALIMVLVMAFGVNILIALFLAIAAMILYYKVKYEDLPPMIANAFSPRLLYTVFAALFLKDVLMESGVVNLLLDYFQAKNLDFTLVIIILPFSICLLTGSSLPGASIAMPLVATMASPDNLYSLAALAIASSMAGLLLSPLHLCFILSVEHFRANFWSSYRKLFLPVMLSFLLSILYTRII